MPISKQKQFVYTLRGAMVLLDRAFRVTWRRFRRGPLLKGWSWIFETTTSFLRRQGAIANAMPSIIEQRLYTDAPLFSSPALKKVRREPVKEEGVKGCWYIPLSDLQDRTVFVHADLSGLPPIYIQAGDAEILIDMIRALVSTPRNREHL